MAKVLLFTSWHKRPVRIKWQINYICYGGLETRQTYESAYIFKFNSLKSGTFHVTTASLACTTVCDRVSTEQPRNLSEARPAMSTRLQVTSITRWAKKVGEIWSANEKGY